MQLWKNKKEINASIKNGRLEIGDEKAFRKNIEAVAENSVFNEDASLREAARWIIWEASLLLECPSASIHDLYMARAKGAYKGFSVPAINIRGLTYEFGMAVFKVLKKLDAKACIFEIARSEISYTNQRPAEYAASILAAAIAEGYKGPVFLQGDHFQVSLKKWKENPAAEIKAVKELAQEAILAGFYNIDIDASTLVDLGKKGVKEEQRNNFEVTTEITRHIRAAEPKGITVSIGGEIGEVGGKNSTAEELIAYLEGVAEGLPKGLIGPSKVSIQTGTTHGGVPLPNGRVAEVRLDFNCLKELGKIARERFKIGGVVQHGASTLPEEAFDHFPKMETLEVHLATGFQNIIYESKHLPTNLRNEIYNWLKVNCAAERKEGETEEQFIYKTRKKGFGPFKERFWNLPKETKEGLTTDLSANIDTIFRKLGIEGSSKQVDKYIKPSPPHMPKNIIISNHRE